MSAIYKVGRAINLGRDINNMQFKTTVEPSESINLLVIPKTHPPNHLYEAITSITTQPRRNLAHLKEHHPN
jgi:hypothetical protein